MQFFSFVSCILSVSSHEVLLLCVILRQVYLPKNLLVLSFFNGILIVI